jgi:hypothetical protein
MRNVSILVCALATLTANAQPADTGNSLESRLSPGFGKASTAVSVGARPNEIVKGKVTYSGIAVQLVKTDNPLQLFNPAAPAKYGSPEDNVMRDPTKGTVSGWKIFSIRF